jgi:hypothetical protein
MDMKEKPMMRLGDFEEERQRIVEEYARGAYLATSADKADPPPEKSTGSVNEASPGQADEHAG